MARADAKKNTAALSTMAGKRNILWLTGLLFLTVFCFYPAAPVAAQQQIGTTAGEKASKRIGGLPDMFGKQSDDGKPVLQRHQVASPPKNKTEDAPKQNTETETEAESGNPETEAGKTAREASNETKPVPEKQSRVYKRLGGMGVDAKGMKKAVFLQSGPNGTDKKDSE